MEPARRPGVALPALAFAQMRASACRSAARLLRTRGIRAARSSSPGTLHRHSVGALTSRAPLAVTASAFAIA